MIKKVFTEKECIDIYNYIDTNYQWKQLRFFTHKIPKVSMCFSKNKIHYNYGKGGTYIGEKELDSFWESILKRINSKFKTSYNHIFIHKYINGNNYISSHKDKSIDWCNCNNDGCGFTSVSLYKKPNVFRPFIIYYKEKTQIINQLNGFGIKLSKKLNNNTEHEIKKDSSNFSRISITCRHII